MEIDAVLMRFEAVEPGKWAGGGADAGAGFDGSGIVSMGEGGVTNFPGGDIVTMDRAPENYEQKGDSI